MNVSRQQLFAIIYGGLGILFALVWYSLSLAPVFSVSILAIVLAVVFYVQTEKHGVVHAASEFENRFWTAIAFIVAIVCFRVEDSPIYIPDHLSIFRWIMMLLLPFLAHNYDRHCRRLQLKRDLHIPRQDTPVDEKMKDLLREVKEHLAWIDHPWISSALMNIFMLSKVLDTERQLIQMFSDCSQQELNYLVTHSLALIMYKMKDHKWVKKYYRTQFIETLAERRICELTIFSRCILVDALQSMKLSAHPKAEHYVKNIFLKTFGDNLSQLKSLSDSKGDFQSMHKLIYFDIHSKEVRQAILDHIKTQARVQKAHMRLGTTQSRRRGEFAWRKILSDVDDTLLCSGGAYPAGIDRSLPRKILYPGVLGFYRELDLGDTGPDHWDPRRTGNLVFLSARPHLYSDIAERHVYDSLNNLQRTRGLYTAPSLLCGSMKTGAQYMFNNTMEPLAQKKVESFKEYAALYAEFEFVFIGDNGQGDVRAAELIHEDSLYTGNLKRAYMRKVKPLSDTHCMSESTKSADCPFICYFTTYVEAAIDAFEHGLIRVGGLRQVALESVQDFENIDWGLFGNKRNDANMQSPRMSAFASNQNLSGSSGVVNKREAPKTQKVGLKESFRKRYMRLLELNASLTQANVLLVKSGLQPVSLLQFECLYRRGTQVTTPFGPGVVERFRAHDGTYEVLLQMGLGDSEEQLQRNCSNRSNMAFLRSDSLLPFRRSSRSWMPSLRSRSSHLSFNSASSANKSLREQLQTHKKSGTTVEEAGAVIGAKDGTKEKEKEQHTIVVYKWVVWTPFGLGILLPDLVDPPPPPLPPPSPPDAEHSQGARKVAAVVTPKVQIHAGASTIMVKVRLRWGAVISIKKEEIVKMKVITVKVYTPPPPPLVSTPTSSSDKAHRTHTSKSKEESPGHQSSRSLSEAPGDTSSDADLPLELRALLSPPRPGTLARKRSVSVDAAGESEAGSDAPLNNQTNSSRLSGLSFIPLYKRLFGSSETETEKNYKKEEIASCSVSHHQEDYAIGNEVVDTGATSKQPHPPSSSPLRSIDEHSAHTHTQTHTGQSSPYSSTSSLRSSGMGSGSSGGDLVEQQSRSRTVFGHDYEHGHGHGHGGCDEDWGSEDEEGVYEHDVGLSIDDTHDTQEDRGGVVLQPPPVTRNRSNSFG